MSPYSTLTRSLGERIEDALERARTSQVEAIQSARKRVGRYTPNLPRLPFRDRLPTAREVAKANFALAERTLEAQKRYVLGLIDAFEPKAKPTRAHKTARKQARSEPPKAPRAAKAAAEAPPQV